MLEKSKFTKLSTRQTFLVYGMCFLTEAIGCYFAQSVLNTLLACYKFHDGME